MKMKMGIRLIRSSNKSAKSKIQFLLNYKNEQTKYFENVSLNKMILNSTLLHSDFLENEEGNLLKDVTQHKHLSIMHLSLRSLNVVFDNFVELLENSSQFFNIIYLSETWISNNDFENNLQYNFPSSISLLLKVEVIKKLKV